MNLNTDRIAWHLNQDSLEIGARVGTVKGVEQKVHFESSNHFDPGEYNKMQKIAGKNPISTLYTFWRKSDRDKGTMAAWFPTTLSRRRSIPNSTTPVSRPCWLQMVAEGFINYYFDRHEIELRDKLIHYALASQGKRDFDAINIESASSRPMPN